MRIGEINCSYDKETFLATATVEIDGRKFASYAKCSSNDADMESPIVGCEIAGKKVLIKALKEYKRELKTGLASLEQLYYSMNRSKHFNEKSYENKMLQSQIQLFKNDLATISKEIAEREQELKEYIKIKDDLYKKLRKIRKRGNSN